MAQYPNRVKSKIDEIIQGFNSSPSVEDKLVIPDTQQISIKENSSWLKIPDVTCVYVDMVNSTKLSAVKHAKTAAKIYSIFTGGIVDLFHEFDAQYIDVKGDGVFALFNSNQCYRALCAAITIKTFCEDSFSPRVNTLIRNQRFKVGAHIGIDRHTLLVKKIGLRSVGGRTDRQNEVWAGRAVNMAAKLASLSKPGELYISDRFYSMITHDMARKGCTCNYYWRPSLWSSRSLIYEDLFDFDMAYVLKTAWCKNCGESFCRELLKLDRA